VRIFGLPREAERRDADAAHRVGDASWRLFRAAHPIERADFKRRGLARRDQHLAFDAPPIRGRPRVERERRHLGAERVAADELRHPGVRQHVGDLPHVRASLLGRLRIPEISQRAQTDDAHAMGGEIRRQPLVDRRPAAVAREEDHGRTRLLGPAVFERQRQRAKALFHLARGRRARCRGLGWTRRDLDQLVHRIVERLAPADRPAEAVPRAGHLDEVHVLHVVEERVHVWRQADLILNAVEHEPVLRHGRHLRQPRGVLLRVECRLEVVRIADRPQRRQIRAEPETEPAGECLRRRARESRIDRRGARRVAEEDRRVVLRQLQRALRRVRDFFERSCRLPTLRADALSCLERRI